MNRQFPALTGIAMLLIVLNHTIEFGFKIPVSHGLPPAPAGVGVVLNLIQALGVFAVPTFLFVSGAFVAYTAKGDPPRLASKFLTATFSRLLWPYLFWSAAFYVTVFLEGERYSALGYIKNVLVGYPYHFMPLLMLCYLISPLLVIVGRRHPAALILTVAAYQLLLLIVLHTNALPAWGHLVVPRVVGKTLSDWGIYFPLGLVYGLHAKAIMPRLADLKPLLIIGTFVCFALGSLYWMGIFGHALIGYLSQLTLVLLLPLISRNSIPFVGALEFVGKRSYALYLTHLIALELALAALLAIGPTLSPYYILLLPLLFLVALGAPMLMMNALARSSARPLYRFVLG